MAIPVDEQGTMYNPSTGKYTGPNAQKYNILSSTQPTIPKFDTGNMQSDGVNTLKRIEFELHGRTYKFILNPEEFSQPEPNRVSLTQTKGGAWIDDFGGGVPEIAFKGTTGFKNGTGDPTSGFNKFKELRDLIREYYFKQAPGTEVTEKQEMIFHNYTDGEHWVVTPKIFSLMRSIARPLMYLYDIQLICQRPANVPASKDENFDIVVLKHNVVGK